MDNSTSALWDFNLWRFKPAFSRTGVRFGLDFIAIKKTGCSKVFKILTADEIRNNFIADYIYNLDITIADIRQRPADFLPSENDRWKKHG